MDFQAGWEAVATKVDGVLAELRAVDANLKDIREIANTFLGESGAVDDGVFFCLVIFVLSCVIGYFVVWSVTPSLHSPLVSVTNAVSSVIVIGAIIVLGNGGASAIASALAFVAIVLASINIFGGFAITQKMLHMFRRRKTH
jgi:NAD(P) transhydrogenase subunit alpha